MRCCSGHWSRLFGKSITKSRGASHPNEISRSPSSSSWVLHFYVIFESSKPELDSSVVSKARAASNEASRWGPDKINSTLQVHFRISLAIARRSLNIHKAEDAFNTWAVQLIYSGFSVDPVSSFLLLLLHLVRFEKEMLATGGNNPPDAPRYNFNASTLNESLTVLLSSFVFLASPLFLHLAPSNISPRFK